LSVAYVVNEQGSSVTVYKLDATTRTLSRCRHCRQDTSCELRRRLELVPPRATSTSVRVWKEAGPPGKLREQDLRSDPVRILPAGH